MYLTFVAPFVNLGVLLRLILCAFLFFVCVRSIQSILLSKKKAETDFM